MPRNITSERDLESNSSIPIFPLFILTEKSNPDFEKIYFSTVLKHVLLDQFIGDWRITLAKICSEYTRCCSIALNDSLGYR
jgi:hypothetical protein